MPTPVTQQYDRQKPTPGYRGDAMRQFGIVRRSNAGPSIPTVWALGQVAMGDTGCDKVARVVGIGAVSSTAIDHLAQGNRQPIQATRNHNPGNVPSPNDPVPACTLKGVNFVDDIGQAVRLTPMMSDFVTDSVAPSRSN